MELRVAVGEEGRLVWRSPTALVGEPTLRVRHPIAGDVQPALSPVRPAVEVVDVGPDGRTLTLSEPLNLPADLVAGDEGDAHVTFPDGGVEAVTVQAIGGGTLTLSDTLRRAVEGVSAETPATLQWAAHIAVIDGVLTATAARNIPCTVSARGVGALGTRAITESGAIHVVAQPLTTGLTVHVLHRHRAYLADSEYRRVSHLPAVEAAFHRLVIWMRADIGMGAWEDDVFNGFDFWLVHLILAEAEIVEDAERAEKLRRDARALYRETTERVLKRDKTTGQAQAAEVDLGGADETHLDYGNSPLRAGRRRRRW